MLTKDQAKNVRDWVAALRSGKYKQTRKRLKDKDGSMCCLGVACDLIAPDDWVDSGDFYRFDGNDGSVSKRVERKYGFSYSGGFIVEDDQGHREGIWEINDNPDWQGPSDNYSNVIPHIIEWYNTNKPEGEEELS